MATYYLLSRVAFTTWLLHLGQLVRNNPKLLVYNNKSKQDYIEAFMGAQLFILIPLFGELIGMGIFFVLLFYYLERFFTWWLSS